MADNEIKDTIDTVEGTVTEPEVTDDDNAVTDEVTTTGTGTDTGADESNSTENESIVDETNTDDDDINNGDNDVDSDLDKSNDEEITQNESETSDIDELITDTSSFTTGQPVNDNEFLDIYENDLTAHKKSVAVGRVYIFDGDKIKNGRIIVCDKDRNAIGWSNISDIK